MTTTTTMPTTQPLTTTTEVADKTTTTVPMQRINFDALKASILAGLIRDTTTSRTRMPTTPPRPTTQPTTTIQQTTTKPENTATTANTMPSNPAQSTVNAPTLYQPQPPPQITIDAADDAADNSPARVLATTKQSTTLTTATEKTTTSDTPTTASTFHLPQQLPQLTDADEDKIGDEFKTPPPTTMPTEEIPAHTNMTEKTLIVDPPTLRKPQTLTPSNADISNDADNDISKIQLTTMPPTTTLTATNTETTEKTTIDDAPATTSPLHKPHPSPQFTGDVADDTEADYPMLPPTTLKPTTNDETTTKTTLCNPDRSTTADDNLSNPPPLMTPIDAFADDMEHNFELMPPTTPPTPTFATLLPDYLSSDYQTTHLSTTTINWVRDSFAPVFKAMHRLEIEIVKLTNNVFAATSNINTVYPPMPPTPNHQPQCHQPQFLHPRTYKRHSKETFPCNAPKIRNRTCTPSIQQNLHPQSTHHCHRNHTKHRNFLWPLSHIFDSHFRKYFSLPAHIHLPNYLRYLAHNFQPP